jgi:hypothetical protein
VTRDKPKAISSISISNGDGAKISSFLPDNILCQALSFILFKFEEIDLTFYVKILFWFFLLKMSFI